MEWNFCNTMILSNLAHIPWDFKATTGSLWRNILSPMVALIIQSMLLTSSIWKAYFSYLTSDESCKIKATMSGLQDTVAVFAPLVAFTEPIIILNFCPLDLSSSGLHVQKADTSLGTSSHNAYTKFFCWLLMHICILISNSPKCVHQMYALSV